MHKATGERQCSSDSGAPCSSDSSDSDGDDHFEDAHGGAGAAAGAEDKAESEEFCETQGGVEPRQGAAWSIEDKRLSETLVVLNSRCKRSTLEIVCFLVLVYICAAVSRFRCKPAL